MALTDIYTGSWGWPIDTEIRKDGEAHDCAWVRAVTVKVKDPSGNVTELDDYHVEFVGPRSYGVVRWTVPWYLFDTAGSWSYQIILSSNNASVPCSIVQFDVLESLGPVPEPQIW